MNGSITVVETISAELSLPVSTSGSLAAEQGVNGSMSIPPPVAHYNGSYEVTPSGQEQTLETGGLLLDNDVAIHAIPPEYVVPSGTMTITENDSYDVTTVAGVVVDVQPELQSKSRTYTPTESQQTESITPDTGYDALSGVSVTVQPIPEEYIIPAGSQTVTENGEYDVTALAEMVVDVDEYVEPTLQTKSMTITPSETQQTEVVVADSGYDGLDEVDVTVSAIPSNYIGSGIERRSASDLTASGSTVTAPAGYYATQATKNVASGSATTPASAITANPTLSVSATGYIEAVVDSSKSITPVVEQGYVWQGTAGTVRAAGHSEMQLPYVLEDSITPSESAQVAVPAGYYTVGDITVEAIPSDYVGTNVAHRTEEDILIMGANVSVPSGYYAERETVSVKAGTAGTPSILKGTPSDHTVYLTPRVINEQGYINGGGVIGDAVTVTAAELVSGTKSITQNDTGIDVTNYASVDVAVPGANLTHGAISILPRATEYTTSLNPEVGQDGFTDVTITVRAMPEGEQGIPVATKGTVSGHGVSVTPSVTNTAGYISGGLHYGEPVTVTAAELVDGTFNVATSGTKDVTNYASAYIPDGTAGTPTATKSSVSNHSVTVTPKVTNSIGWISTGTITGDPVTVSASELVSGSRQMYVNGTYDVTNYAQVEVDIPSPTPMFDVDFTASPASATCNKTYSQCVEYYDADVTAGVIADVTTSNGSVRLGGSAAVYQLNAYILYTVYTEQGKPAFDLRYYPNGTIAVENPSSLIVQAGTPTATKGSVANHSISVTPSVTNPSGYINSGTKTGNAVTVTASELVSGSLTIPSNDTYDVTNYAEVVVNVSSGVDGNDLAYGTGSYLVGTAKVGTAYAWTDYQGSNIGIINKAIVGTDAVV